MSGWPFFISKFSGLGSHARRSDSGARSLGPLSDSGESARTGSAVRHCGSLSWTTTAALTPYLPRELSSTCELVTTTATFVATAHSACLYPVPAGSTHGTSSHHRAMTVTTHLATTRLPAAHRVTDIDSDFNLNPSTAAASTASATAASENVC